MISKHEVGFGAALAVLSLAVPAAAYDFTSQVTLKQAGDVTAGANTGTLVIGDSSGKQVAFDDNEIQARGIGGDVATLTLQAEGGQLHTAATSIRINRLPHSIHVGGFEALGFDAFAGSVNVKIGGELLTVFAPAHLFESATVHGKLYLEDQPAVSGSAVCMNSSSGSVGTCPSSRAFKRDIVDLARGLPDVMAMRPVAFTWKEDGRPDVGFIAEEALGVLPELVAHDSQGTVRTFNYQGYTAVLTRAVQEQEDAIASLRGELQTKTRDFGRQLDELNTEIASRDRELAAQSQEIHALRRQFAELASAVAGLQKRTPGL